MSGSKQKARIRRRIVKVRREEKKEIPDRIYTVEIRFRVKD